MDISVAPKRYVNYKSFKDSCPAKWQSYHFEQRELNQFYSPEVEFQA